MHKPRIFGYANPVREGLSLIQPGNHARPMVFPAFKREIWNTGGNSVWKEISGESHGERPAKVSGSEDRL
jgi:hypothetical protein